MMDLSTLTTGQELMDTAGIKYTRPLDQYPTASDVVGFLLEKKPKKHVYTQDLNINGTAVQDAMERYLETDAYQSSHLKQALITPMHLNFSLNDKAELERFKAKKDYFELGTFLHQCILEPTKFQRVIIEPKYSLASKEGVDNLIGFWKEQIQKQGFGCDQQNEQIEVEHALQLALNKVTELGLNIEKQDGKKTYYCALKQLSGQEAVSEEHYLKIQILKNRYQNYGGGILKDLLLYSKREISFYYQHQNGLNLKCRPDAIQFAENIGVNAIISVKSTACEDLRAFTYNAAKMHYDLTEGMYQEVVSSVTGRDFNTTIMIMLQTVAPFGIAVLVWNAQDIETGKYKFHSALEVAKRCQQKNKYPGYELFAKDHDFGLIDMQLPRWNNSDLDIIF